MLKQVSQYDDRLNFNWTNFNNFTNKANARHDA